MSSRDDGAQSHDGDAEQQAIRLDWPSVYGRVQMACHFSASRQQRNTHILERLHQSVSSTRLIRSRSRIHKVAVHCCFGYKKLRPTFAPWYYHFFYSPAHRPKFCVVETTCMLSFGRTPTPCGVPRRFEIHRLHAVALGQSS